MARKKRSALPPAAVQSRPGRSARASSAGGESPSAPAGDATEAVAPLFQFNRRFLLAAAILILLPCVAYAPLWKAGFIWDDDDYVTKNEMLRSASGLFNIWFNPRSIPQYYPLVHTTFWIEYQTWGLHPTGYHVVNVLLHGISSFLLWRLLAYLRVPGAFFAAAIFAVHPIMTESVAWVTERKNVLSLPLALGSLLCYLRFERLRALQSETGMQPWHLYAVSLLLFLCALFSKTVVCTLPAVILVIHWWKHGQLRYRPLLPLIPFFVLGISLGLTTAWLEKYHVGAQGAEWSLSLLDRLLLSGRNVWFYAEKIVWPAPLMFFYPRWNIDSSQAWQYLFPIALGLVVVALWTLRHVLGRGPLAAILIFVGVLFPALGFIDVYPFRYSFVADHFQYHASVALIALLAASAAQVVALLPSRFLTGFRVAAAVLLAVLVLLTFRQARVYHDFESVFVDNLAKNPASWGATSNLVTYYLNSERLDEALAVAEQGVKASPHVADVHNALGAAVLQHSLHRGTEPGRLAAAMEHFSMAIKIEPRYSEAYFNLCTTLALLERIEETVPYYERLLEIVPDDVEAMVGLAKSWIIMGRAEQAVPLIETALRLAPRQASALHAQGLLQAREGLWDDAIRSYQAALGLDSGLTVAHFDLAAAYLAKQQYVLARDEYHQVLARQPWNVRALNNLGVVYMNLGQPRDAIDQFSRAVELAPEYQQAGDNLRRAREALNNP